MSTFEAFEQSVDVDLLGSFKALAAESGQWKTALCELIDNGYDQGARAISITIDRDQRRFEIEDDGDGCSDFSLLVGLGCRKATTKNKIGMHGWGAKRALLFIAHDVGCVLNLETCYRGSLFVASTTFENIGTNRSFTVRPSRSITKRKGTRIELTGFKRSHVPTAKAADMENLTAQLGFMYSLAIEDGRHLIVTSVARKQRERVALAPYAPPEFTDEILDTFQLDEKRSVRLRVGVVAQGQRNGRAGLHYRYGYRVIEEGSSKGCGDYSASRIFGFVDLLGDGWKLAALKDEVYEPGSLHAEILARIEPLLQKAQGQQLVAESSLLIENAERLLNAGMERALKGKASRPGRGKKNGKSSATGRGPKHKDAEHKQPGATMPLGGSSGRGRLRIDFAEFDDFILGDLTGSNTVRLNTRVGAVARARHNPGLPESAHDIYQAAMTVYLFMRRFKEHLDSQMVIDALKDLGRALSAEGEATMNGMRLIADGESGVAA